MEKIVRIQDCDLEGIKEILPYVFENKIPVVIVLNNQVISHIENSSLVVGNNNEDVNQQVGK